jgi:hypothetical protein
MKELRKETRYNSQAKVKFLDIDGGEGFLKNLSITGCRMECSNSGAVELNAQYRIEIIPEKAAEIGPFDLLVKSKWIRPGGHSLEAGFTIVESPKGKQFQQYVDYLSWRYSQGDSMTGSGPDED